MLSESPKPNAETGETTFLQGELAKTPRASHSDDAVPDQGARLNVRNPDALETVPDETEDDARTLCCEWNEHGERFKPFRKSVLECETYDWKNGRFEGAPTCLHTCAAMGKLWEQSKAVTGSFSERQNTSAVKTGLLTSSVICVTCSRKRRVFISSIWEPWLVWKS